MKNILYIGSFVSLSDSLSNYGFSQAANLFQQKFIEFVDPDISISIIPIFCTNKLNLNYHKKVYFINNQIGLRGKANYVFRFLFDSIQVLYLINKYKKKKLFFYNVDYQNILIIIISKFIFKKNVFIIIADYDNYGNRLKDFIFNWILKNIDGVIVLNSNIKCNKNSRLLNGLLYQNEIICTESLGLNKNVILSGSLGKTTGLEFALEYFSKNTEYNLFITGRPFRYVAGEFEKLISCYQSKCKNIFYFGLLEYKKYIEILNKCDIALSLRNPNDNEHDYNFPSKILEYLSKSKVVISTKKYEDIPDDILFYCEFNHDSFSNALTSIHESDLSYLMALKKRIYTYLNSNFTKGNLLNIVNDLINDKSS